MNTAVKPLPPLIFSSSSSSSHTISAENLQDDASSCASSSEESTVVNTPRNSDVIPPSALVRRGSSISTTFSANGSSSVNALACNTKKQFMAPLPPFSLLKRAKSYSSSSNNSSDVPPVPLLPFHSTTNTVQTSTSLLERKIEDLEQELSEHIKRESELASQVWILSQQRGCYDDSDQIKSKYRRMNQHIEHFLNSRKTTTTPTSTNNSDRRLTFQQDITNEVSSRDNRTTTLAIVWMYRIKSIVEQYRTDHTTAANSKGLFEEIETLFEAWQMYNNSNSDSSRQKDTVRSSPLVKSVGDKQAIRDLSDALEKSQARNETIEAHYQALVKHYQSELDNIKNNYIQQIDDYKAQLQTCQEQKEEFEQTLDMVRKEMQMMLEELEETKQQKTRYKAQANRLKANLDAVHRSSHNSNSQNDDGSGVCGVKHVRDGDGKNDSSTDTEVEGFEALRVLYHEAERQASDLERENKRQALTISSLRREVKKLTEEALVVMKNKAKKKKVNECSCQRETWYNDHDDDTLKCCRTTAGKIHALQIAYRAAQADATIQHARVKQLQQQHETINMDLTRHLQAIVQQLHYWFQQQQQQQCTTCNKHDKTFLEREIAENIELERRLWKDTCKKDMQKQFDIDLLHVHRELRQAIAEISGLEEHIHDLQSRHKQELMQSKYESRLHHDRRVHRLIMQHKRKEFELEKNLEVTSQKNKALEDELSVLHGRNMMMAQKLVSLTV